MDPNILSIILYGSRARRDHDKSSDLDICILTKERQAEEISLEEIEKVVVPLQPKEIIQTCYPDSVVNSMLEHGSLFLWHLKLEGEVLYGEDYFVSKIKRLKKFKNHQDEIIYHSELFQDLKRAWKRLDIINELDLSLLFTVTRNTCMVLSHNAGKPSFGRISCFSSAKQLFPKLPMIIDDYLYLSSWKIIYERGIKSHQSLPNLKKYKSIILNVENLLKYATEKITQ
jgi:predicted nucleotidyltransferase